MTKQELWAHYCRRNPQFYGGGNVTLSAAGLRKLFDATWDQSHKQGFANGVAWEKANSKPSQDPMDIFKGLFN